MHTPSSSRKANPREMNPIVHAFKRQGTQPGRRSRMPDYSERLRVARLDYVVTLTGKFIGQNLLGMLFAVDEPDGGGRLLHAFNKPHQIGLIGVS